VPDRGRDQQQALRPGSGAGDVDFTDRVLDALVAFVAVLAPDGTLLRVNSAPLELAGITADDVIGRPFWECFWWTSSSAAAAEIEAAVAGAAAGRATRFDTRPRFAAGAHLWVDVQIAPLFAGDGSVSHVIASGVDVSARKAAEAELEQREAQLRTIFTSLDEGFCVCEIVLDGSGAAVDYRFLEVNPLFEAMTGLRDAVGRTALELLPDLEPFWVETYGRVAAGGAPLRFEQESPAMGRIFDVFCMPVEPRGRFAIVFKDVSARRRAELALRESEQRFRAMADGLPLVLWMHDADGRLEFVNQTFCDVFGVTRAEMVDDRWTVLVHPDDAPRYAEAFARAVAEQSEFHAEARVRAASGEWRWLESWARPRFADGTFLGHVGTSADITERRRIEEGLRRRHAQAELVAAAIAELERLGDLDSQLRRLPELLVPGVADHAEVREADADGPLPAGPGARDRRLVAPLRLGDGLARTLVAELRDPRRPPFDGEDERSFRDLAERAGVVLASAQVARREHEISLRLQQALLPTSVVATPEVEIGARYVAAADMLDVGGDWYDTLLLADGRILLVVGDVVGHGLEAASAMGRLRAAVAAFATLTSDPGELLAGLHRVARAPEGAEFVTACCAVLDPGRGTLTYASAGHPPILLVEPSGEATWLDEGLSPPMGALEVDSRPNATVDVPPGGLLLVYTDGLVERRDRHLDAGLDVLREHAIELRDRAPQQICDELVDRLLVAPPQHNDDTVVMCVRLRAR